MGRFIIFFFFLFYASIYDNALFFSMYLDHMVLFEDLFPQIFEIELAACLADHMLLKLFIAGQVVEWVELVVEVEDVG